MTAPGQRSSEDQPQSRSWRRLLWVGVGLLIVLGAGAGYLSITRDAAAEANSGLSSPAKTAQVTRETISDTRSFGGTLGHGAAATVTTSGQGVVTRITGQGSDVRPGTELFRLDERPVTALHGTIPMYRDLRSGHSGLDVAQFEENLAGLGYTGFTVDEVFTSATAAAVRRWQADLGLPETGVVAHSDVVFVPEGSRVDTIHARVGGVVTPGAAVLDLTGVDQVVSLEIDVHDRELLIVGAQVLVRLPGGEEVAGIVSAANAVQAEPATGGGTGGTGAAGADDTIINVEVTLRDSVDESFLGAPVDVLVEIDERAEVLTVPLNALLALAGGGHGLEVVADDGTRRVVEVETGLFAGGRVEITGDGLREGTVVVVAGR